MSLPKLHIRTIAFMLFSMPILGIAQEAITAQFIADELQRAKTEPDHRVTIYLNAPISEVFATLLLRFDEYAADVKSLGFDHSQSASPGLINTGSERLTVLESDKTLVQRLLEYDPPHAFAIYTDMAKSDASVPIDYSIAQYQIMEQEDGTVAAQVSLVFRPSSRLTGIVVGRIFINSMERDFKSAEDYLNNSR